MTPLMPGVSNMISGSGLELLIWGVVALLLFCLSVKFLLGEILHTFGEICSLKRNETNLSERDEFPVSGFFFFW